MGNEVWAGLPEHQNGLIEFFKKYGDIQFEGEIIRKLRNLSSAERKEIESALKVLDEDSLDDWIDQHGIVNHEGARLAYFAMSFLAI